MCSTTIGEFSVSDEGVVDASWMGEKLGKKVIAAKVKNFDDKMGGLSGDFNVLEVELEEGNTLSLILKTTNKSRKDLAATLGTPREGLFLQAFSEKLQGIIPKAFYGTGDLKTGEKVLIMEKLENSVPAGIFFGPGNPNNWGIKEQLPEMCKGNPSAIETSKHAFRLYAQLHSRFWKDQELLSHEWLRAADWHQGKGKEGWVAAQKLAQDAWVKVKESIAAGNPKINWDPHTVKCIDESMAQVSWETYQKEITLRPWTIVHGDCHPHNTMWARQRTPDASLYLIDFEMVGVGSPAQELGQFLVSHMETNERRSCERELVEYYHKHLIDNLRERGLQEEADVYSFESCWEEYKVGGIGRWFWFVPYLQELMPAELSQFFHDQTKDFLHDHFPKPEDVRMPRV
eukprot:CAMPEP_0201488982 /NCGR_PEP_ID=MMETSP0151_2-20130828/20833_1 /ASSEMBLY_ACC=CAM_ASM_000257 /TAXON_ID=200890 /ORGANISM="Paramoeba atlantica, Strain 621/1 / CCAP 1560/9" /LENGTH=400 /DNA_ID=CAMNT_0047874435 /DNA_START=94 /DNA_END=1296 /DNA_ORIENTATION=+